MNSTLRLILDLGPLAVFLVAYRFQGLLAATAALIAFTLVSLAITYALTRKIATMPLVSGIAVTLLGGLTLLLQDEMFIKIKPTIVNCIFASILLGGLYFGKPLLKYLLEGAMQLSEEGWKKLSLRWGIFFLFLAALNECVWRNFPTDFWVNFKVFGMLTLTLLFTFAQLPLIKKYWVEAKKPEN
jgi:intracellular septation protein